MINIFDFYSIMTWWVDINFYQFISSYSTYVCIYLFILFKKEDNVYNIKNGLIKLANKTFNKSKNDFEIIFNQTTTIERSDDTDIPSHPRLKTIEDVLSMAKNTLIGDNLDILTII